MKYDDNIMNEVINLSNEATSKLIDANSKLSSAYNNLNSKIQNSTSKIQVDDSEKIQNKAKKIVDMMNDKVLEINGIGNIDTSLTLNESSIDLNQINYLNNSLNKEFALDDTLIEEILANDNLSDEVKTSIREYLDKENYEAVLLLLTIAFYDQEIADLIQLRNKIENFQRNGGTLSVTEVEVFKKLNLSVYKDNAGEVINLLNQEIKTLEIERNKYNETFKISKYNDIYAKMGTEEFIQYENSNVGEEFLTFVENKLNDEYTFSGTYWQNNDSPISKFNYLYNLFLEEKGYKTLGNDTSNFNRIAFLNFLYNNEDYKNYLEDNGLIDLDKEETKKDVLYGFSGFNPSDEYDLVQKCFLYMTDEELNCYNYLYNTNQERAKEYLSDLEGIINSRMADELVMSDLKEVMTGNTSLSRVFKNSLNGARGGLNEWFEDAMALIDPSEVLTVNDYRILKMGEVYTNLVNMAEVSNDQLEVLHNDGFISDSSYQTLTTKQSKGTIINADILYCEGDFNDLEYEFWKKLYEDEDTKKLLEITKGETDFLNNSYQISRAIGYDSPKIALSLIAKNVVGGVGGDEAFKNVWLGMTYYSTFGKSLNDNLQNGLDDYHSYLNAFTQVIKIVPRTFIITHLPTISTETENKFLNFGIGLLNQSFKNFTGGIFDSVLNEVTKGENISLDLKQLFANALKSSVQSKLNLKVNKNPVATGEKTLDTTTNLVSDITQGNFTESIQELSDENINNEVIDKETANLGHFINAKGETKEKSMDN